VPEGYAAAFNRRERALRGYAGSFSVGETRLYKLKLAGRAVIGIGAASVRETNLSLLRPWGIPYVPGSALKGLASHVAHQAGGPWIRSAEAGGEAGPAHTAVFGDVTCSGAVVFHDAWWQPVGDRSPVEPDTMTVHHAEYYKGNAAPADWDEPNPVSFLTTTGTYLAALTGPSEALDAAEELLRIGLRDFGIGAKTAAGYGRAALERHLSEFARSLDAFQRPPAAPNNIQHLRELRVWYVPDKKSDKRFGVHIDGQKKEFKGQVLAIDPQLVHELRTAGDAGLVLQVRLEGGRAKGVSRP
jgi:CRISPR type III-B/RAMP module RAMP protein Cmr6